jgi:hypothetical protein
MFTPGSISSPIQGLPWANTLGLFSLLMSDKEKGFMILMLVVNVIELIFCITEKGPHKLASTF